MIDDQNVYVIGVDHAAPGGDYTVFADAAGRALRIEGEPVVLVAGASAGKSWSGRDHGALMERLRAGVTVDLDLGRHNVRDFLEQLQRIPSLPAKHVSDASRRWRDHWLRGWGKDATPQAAAPRRPRFTASSCPVGVRARQLRRRRSPIQHASRVANRRS